jgi:NAD(P)H-dependent FMN reductase
MDATRPIFISVILGTARMGRMILHAARLVTREVGKRAGVETELIDITQLPLPTNDAGEAIIGPTRWSLCLPNTTMGTPVC